MFASRTLPEHLLRGALDIGLFVCAGLTLPAYPWLSLIAIPLAMLALRGCPMCWLFETLAARASGRHADSNACVAGRCVLDDERAT